MVAKCLLFVCLTIIRWSPILICNEMFKIVTEFIFEAMMCHCEAVDSVAINYMYNVP